MAETTRKTARIAVTWLSDGGWNRREGEMDFSFIPDNALILNIDYRFLIGRALILSRVHEFERIGEAEEEDADDA